MVALQNASSPFAPSGLGLMESHVNNIIVATDLPPNIDQEAMETALLSAAATSTSPSITKMRNITPSWAVYPSPTPFSGRLIPDTSFPPPLVYIDTALGSVVALYVVGPQLAGHPNILHGGASAALVDEIMGRTAVERLPARKVAVTATLELTYKAPVFLGSDGGWGLVAVCARVQSAAGRMAQVVGSVENIKTGQKLVEARGTFVEPMGT